MRTWRKKWQRSQLLISRSPWSMLGGVSAMPTFANTWHSLKHCSNPGDLDPSSGFPTRKRVLLVLIHLQLLLVQPTKMICTVRLCTSWLFPANAILDFIFCFFCFFNFFTIFTGNQWLLLASFLVYNAHCYFIYFLTNELKETISNKSHIFNCSWEFSSVTPLN